MGSFRSSIIKTTGSLGAPFITIMVTHVHICLVLVSGKISLLISTILLVIIVLVVVVIIIN